MRMDSLLLADDAGFADPKWLLVIAAILFTIVMLNIARRRRREGGTPKDYTREVDSATRRSMVIKRDMEALLVELNELSRVINGQLDTRFAKLEISIADADRRIAELRSLLIKAGIEPEPASENQDGAAPKISADELPVPRLDVVVDESGESDSSDSSGQQQDDGLDEFHRTVHRMADEGRSPVEIAGLTQRAVGEVELVLHLRRRAMRRNAAVSPTHADGDS